ncbi:hypothetical protein BgiBS90_004327, partial [Biomphalaria glabrata]
RKVNVILLASFTEQKRASPLLTHSLVHKLISDHKRSEIVCFHIWQDEDGQKYFKDEASWELDITFVSLHFSVQCVLYERDS